MFTTLQPTQNQHMDEEERTIVGQPAQPDTATFDSRFAPRGRKVNGPGARGIKVAG